MPLGEDGRGRDREIAPTALPLGDGRGRDREIAPTALPLGDGRGRDREIDPMTIFLDAATYPKILSFSFSYASTTGASSS